MKKQFAKPEVEIVCLSTNDIIATSAGYGINGAAATNDALESEDHKGYSVIW